jgi:hypothetical protein
MHVGQAAGLGPLRRSRRRRYRLPTGGEGGSNTGSRGPLPDDRRLHPVGSSAGEDGIGGRRTSVQRKLPDRLAGRFGEPDVAVRLLVMPDGELNRLGVVNSVTVPSGLICAIWSPLPDVPGSANQKLPSGPAVIPCGRLSGLGTANSLTAPSGVIRPTWLAAASVNQTLPSGPAVMDTGWPPGVGMTNSVPRPS